jgi:hypothetical protein
MSFQICGCRLVANQVFIGDILPKENFKILIQKWIDLWGFQSWNAMENLVKIIKCLDLVLGV